ncbi:MAG: response regulator receiver [Acidimicrobiales bacterium]|nr:response regulator receiver [Acidimicrobiales bacterium]
MGWVLDQFVADPQRSPSEFTGSAATMEAMTGERLLLVDDEENLRSMLEAALRHSGFEVHPAASGREALAAMEEVAPDLVVLDVMLPDLDGFDVCQRLRSSGSRTPVLFLTARDATEDKVRGLTMGGDDYLVKPFSLDELVARINAVLRRTGNARDGGVLSCADLQLDDEAHLVIKAGDEVALSPTEYNLLRYLMINQGRVLSKSQILDHVWQYDFGGEGGVVETYIGYLRRKLDRTGTQLIHTVRGVGYTLREPRN